VGRFGYCGAALVHLLLTGRGVSNSVDGGGGGGGGFGGVAARADVGFVPAAAALGQTAVGARLRVPRSPVWVAFSESHFFLLFVPPEGCVWPPSVAAPAAPPRTFGKRPKRPPAPPDARRCVGLRAVDAPGGARGDTDLLWFDGLAKQTRAHRLTVEGAVFGGAAGAAGDPGRIDFELSGLELIVGTIFGPQAAVNWNDVMPEEALTI
jgi:hypothetical protein